MTSRMKRDKEYFTSEDHRNENMVEYKQFALLLAIVGSDKEET